jgi:hypothetical protein
MVLVIVRQGGWTALKVAKNPSNESQKNNFRQPRELKTGTVTA